MKPVESNRLMDECNDKRTMRQFRLILLLILLPILLGAQLQPCTDPPMMTSVCAEACIICIFYTKSLQFQKSHIVVPSPNWFPSSINQHQRDH